MSQNSDPQKKAKRDRSSHLVRIPSPPHLVGWSIAGALGSSVGLFLLTGLATSPWQFLLYPLLIGVLLLSLGTLALHFLQRL